MNECVRLPSMPPEPVPALVQPQAGSRIILGHLVASVTAERAAGGRACAGKPQPGSRSCKGPVQLSATAKRAAEAYCANAARARVHGLDRVGHVCL